MPDQNDNLDSIIATREAEPNDPPQLASIALDLWAKLQQARDHQRQFEASEQALAAHDQTAAKHLENALGTREELTQAIQALGAGLDCRSAS